MKKIILSLITLCIAYSGITQSNGYVRPSAIGISFYFNDFSTAQQIRNSSLSKVLSNKEWAKLNEMDPGIAISYFKGLKNHIDFAATLGGSFVNYPTQNSNSNSSELLLEADASFQFKLTTERFLLQPYFSAGVGAYKYKVYYGGFVPVGVGLKLNLFNEAAIFVNSQYRIPTNTTSGAYHFFHNLGIAGIIGKKMEEPLKTVEIPQAKDTDGDGIIDDNDKCPDVPGVEKYEGCPIPDTDNDGINDDEDKCPTVPGIAKYEGCPIPDTDGDGVNDEEDKCPSVAGVARYEGCPVPDFDGDGVNDEEDKCPQVAGSIANKGCPEIEDAVIQKVNYAAQNILFVTGKYTLQSSSNKGLDEVAKVLEQSPDLMITISGHTDNVGEEAMNQTLSENRANTVRQYFIKKGISENRISANGFGELQPIADNKTAAGRTKNRRVELTIGY
jgi:outer membrane protein OmpA-like peptidoglycan-associated protein